MKQDNDKILFELTELFGKNGLVQKDFSELKESIKSLTATLSNKKEDSKPRTLSGDWKDFTQELKDSFFNRPKTYITGKKDTYEDNTEQQNSVDVENTKDESDIKFKKKGTSKSVSSQENSKIEITRNKILSDMVEVLIDLKDDKTQSKINLELLEINKLITATKNNFKNTIEPNNEEYKQEDREKLAEAIARRLSDLGTSGKPSPTNIPPAVPLPSKVPTTPPSAPAPAAPQTPTTPPSAPAPAAPQTPTPAPAPVVPPAVKPTPAPAPVVPPAVKPPSAPAPAAPQTPTTPPSAPAPAAPQTPTPAPAPVVPPAVKPPKETASPSKSKVEEKPSASRQKELDAVRAEEELAIQATQKLAKKRETSDVKKEQPQIQEPATKTPKLVENPEAISTKKSNLLDVKGDLSAASLNDTQKIAINNLFADMGFRELLGTETGDKVWSDKVNQYKKSNPKRLKSLIDAANVEIKNVEIKNIEIEKGKKISVSPSSQFKENDEKVKEVTPGKQVSNKVKVSPSKELVRRPPTEDDTRLSVRQQHLTDSLRKEAEQIKAKKQDTNNKGDDLSSLSLENMDLKGFELENNQVSFISNMNVTNTEQTTISKNTSIRQNPYERYWSSQA